jgi:hypothetical protein
MQHQPSRLLGLRCPLTLAFFGRPQTLILVLLITGLTTVACSRSSPDAAPAAVYEAASPVEQPAAEAAQFSQVSGLSPAMMAPSAQPSSPGMAAVLPTIVGVSAQSVSTSTQAGVGSDRMIIKNAELGLHVDDTDVAINRITQITADAGGYILSSQTWLQQDADNEYKYASLTLSVPADQFETILVRLRQVAVKVVLDNSAGNDVTAEFVDLESGLNNLKATRDRIRGFLEQTKTVEEALRVNEQLSMVEGQIAATQGRMNYLAGRSAHSTIAVTIGPEIPPVTEPTPTPDAWRPSVTVTKASGALRTVYQAIADLLIWVVIVVVPVVLPVALLAWVVVRVGRR